jgi:acyl dehydratase
MEALYLDDLKPGDVFESGGYTVTADDIKAFAREFDPQPFHLDEKTAEAGFFHGLIASGWHTAAITMRLMVESMPMGSGSIGASVELTWTRPVRPGERLCAKTVIDEVKLSRSKPDRGIVHTTTETRNERGELCQVMRSKVVAFRRP